MTTQTASTITQLPTDPAARLTLTVTDRVIESENVISLRLSDPQGRKLPPWSPGAHIDFHIDGMIRQYSLCSAVTDRDSWRLGILKEADGRGGSAAVHEKINVGTEVTVSPPRNNFILEPSSSYVFIAGGIGVTPILPMIAEADRAGSDWNLVYGGRTRSTMAFVSELEKYGERVQIVPQDTNGYMEFVEYFKDVRPDTLIYACGPEPMLVALESATSHWPDGTLHTERFVPREIDESNNTEFEVEFVDSGVTLTVPADKSILEVAEENDLPVLSSCSEGTCGTCETPVLSGTPQHRDSILSENERAQNDCMFICVSRSQNGCPLRLDL